MLLTLKTPMKHLMADHSLFDYEEVMCYLSIGLYCLVILQVSISKAY